MKVIVNSKEVDTQASHLDQLAAQLELPAVGVAVAVGNKMIPRTAWSETALTEGVAVTVIKAACGG